MIDLKDIHIEVLKYMFDNNTRISKLSGYPKEKISHRIEAPNNDVKAAVVYLSDISLLIKSTRRVKSISNPKETFTEEKFRISPKGIEIYEKEIMKMGIDESLKELIDLDIIRLETSSHEETFAIFDKFKNHIDGVNNNLTYSSRFREELKAALEGFRIFGYKNRLDNTRVGTQFNVNNQNESNITNTIDITITFDQARSKIEDIPYLTPEAIAEIVEKINELEAINNEETSKPKKWAKARGVLHWLGTQGIEIATTIIPLVLKVISETGA